MSSAATPRKSSGLSVAGYCLVSVWLSGYFITDAPKAPRCGFPVRLRAICTNAPKRPHAAQRLLVSAWRAWLVSWFLLSPPLLSAPWCWFNCHRSGNWPVSRFTRSSLFCRWRLSGCWSAAATNSAVFKSGANQISISCNLLLGVASSYWAFTSMSSRCSAARWEESEGGPCDWYYQTKWTTTKRKLLQGETARKHFGRLLECTDSSWSSRINRPCRIWKCYIMARDQTRGDQPRRAPYRR